MSIATRGFAASASATVVGRDRAGDGGAPGAATTGAPASAGFSAVDCGGVTFVCSLGLRRVLLLVEGTGVEILPGGHHQDRQGDGEKEVSRVLVVHGRLFLPFGVVCAAGRRPSLSLHLYGPEGPAQILDQSGEVSRQSLASGHQHVVAIRACLKWARSAQRFSEPAADAVAYDRVADLPRHRDAEPRAARRLIAALAAGRLQGEGLDSPSAVRGRRAETRRAASDARRPRLPGPASRPCPGIAAPSATSHGEEGSRAATQSGRRLSRSGGELLAAAGAARVQNFAAADGRHAGAEAVAALAHELAGLISPLHDRRLQRRLRRATRAPGPVVANGGEPGKNFAALSRRFERGLCGALGAKSIAPTAGGEDGDRLRGILDWVSASRP